jgi:hypothetical protein
MADGPEGRHNAMKTNGKLSVSFALYLLVTLFWYAQLIIGAAINIAAIWLLSTQSGPEIIGIMEDEASVRELRGIIYYSLIWLKSDPWLSMLISTIGGILAWISQLWATHHLRKLIENIQTNQIYSANNMAHSRMIALGIFALIVLDAAFKKHFEWINLFLALVALVFVEILRQGLALAEEQKYTI